MRIDGKEAARLLLAQDSFLVFSHKNPDGDTIGSAFGLIHALRALGKQVAFRCQDPVPKKYSYLTQGYQDDPVENPYLVAVDLADPQLFGSTLQEYPEKIDLCIDHHISNKEYAKHLALDAEAPACAQLMLEVIEAMGVEISPKIANCLYTGLCTDTGCFLHSNVTAKCHRVAARLIEAGADFVKINTLLFSSKEKNRLALEQEAISGLEYAFEDRMALLLITQKMLNAHGLTPQELEGLSQLPRQIEGVEAGVTVTEQPNGDYKVSLRTAETVSANEIAGELGGGGHPRAAGCVLKGSWQEVHQTLLDAVGRRLKG